MSPQDRARAAHAAAEAADHPRDKAAWRAAAALWERIAGPGVAWSHELARAELRQLRIDVAVARGSFQPPQPPKAPAPAQQDAGCPDCGQRWGFHDPRHHALAQEAAIEF